MPKCKSENNLGNLANLRHLGVLGPETDPTLPPFLLGEDRKSHRRVSGAKMQISQANASNVFEAIERYEKKLYDVTTAAAHAAECSKAQNDALVEQLAERAQRISDLEREVVSVKREVRDIRGIAANTAHDLKSPLNTLVLGKYYSLCNQLYEYKELL